MRKTLGNIAYGIIAIAALASCFAAGYIITLAIGGAR